MMNDDKYLRLYGFLIGFFKHNLDIMGTEVSEEVLEFFRKGYLLKECNTTLIILIPNMVKSKDPKEYIPIIIYNVMYKILTKIMVERLKLILPSIILEEQDSFMKGK